MYLQAAGAADPAAKKAKTEQAAAAVDLKTEAQNGKVLDDFQSFFSDLRHTISYEFQAVLF